jgi:hypothetical protein
MKKLITLHYLLLFIFLAGYTQVDFPDSLLTAPETKAFIKGGNVFVSLPDGSQKQLTFTRSDERPMVMKSTNQVLFFRNERIAKGDVEYTRKKIMSRNHIKTVRIILMKY